LFSSFLLFLSSRSAASSFPSSPYTTLFRSYRFGAQQAQAKVVVAKASGRVVGATLLSDVADEMINYFTLLIEKHVTLPDLQRLVLAYPTPASDLQYLY